MPCMKRNAPDKIKKALRSLRDLLTEDSDMRKEVDKVLDAMSEVSASDLMFSEVRDMFGLKLDKRSMEFWELKKSDIIPVPEVVLSRIKDMEKVIGPDPRGKTRIRLRLDIIFLDCVRAEQICLGMKDSAKEKPISLSTETNLECRINHKRESILLNARSDYTMWHCNGRSGMDTNFVICTNFGEESNAFAHCLAYMGMVHRIRQQENRSDSTVYGCVTDGNSFSFLRINSKNKYSIWHSQIWDAAWSSDTIWTQSVRISKYVSEQSLSPRKPVKTDTNRNKVVCNTPEGRKYWELQFGRVDESDESDEEMEV